MGSGPSLPADKKIVIVGAGYAGSKLGTELLKQKADFVIIDVKDSFYHNVGAVRAVTQPGFASKLFILYAQTFGEHFKQARVTSIEPTDRKVILEGGEQLEFDVLIIATGSTGHAPFKPSIDKPEKEEILKDCQDIVEKVKQSKEFVIIGGGAVGCEIAAELLTDYKDVKVTLIHSSNTLVSETLGEGFQKNVQQKLKNMGTNLILGETVVTGLEDKAVYGPCDVSTDKGNSFKADLVFRATGLKVNSEAYASSFREIMNENGSLQVNEFLQLKGYSNIFALGDCNDAQELKLAYRAGEQVKVMQQNLIALFNDQPLRSYDPKSASFGIGLSLGRNDGIGVTANGWNVPSFIIKMYKSKDLMVGQFWSQMNQKVPS